MVGEGYAIADRLKFFLEQSGESRTQEMFSIGWKHDHYVGNVFVFVPKNFLLPVYIIARETWPIERFGITKVFMNG